ncbi:MAG: hypothetical protein ACI8RZ_007160 [Myxococcota bacterium]|jgi:hypothetical protein
MIGGLIALGAVVAVGVIGGVVASDPRPEGEPGAAAEALTDTIQASVRVDAWAQTGAVQWTFGGRNTHLWDRVRHLDRVEWGNKTVLIDLSTQQGRAWVDDEEVTGSKADRLVGKAWAHWCNDAFWFNPIGKLRDEGTTRSLVSLPEGDALLISYSSGGVTPGDAYLWIPGEDGRPDAWRMWVSIIPIGGVTTTWEDWQTLSTGAVVATSHKMGPVDLVMADVAGAATLSELIPGDDPFAPLLQ